ncbi:MAG: chemotaxis protein CheW [Candidatus Hydrogenedentes bacterium]|nr:chemotaxis protein CheW [Candidatus Hydrogenedentota bacterium]
MRQIATMRLGEQLFGVDILLVREINRLVDITPVPHATHYIRGLVNLRGLVVTVFDLGERLGMGRTGISPASHNVILKAEPELARIRLQAEFKEELISSDDPTGLLVDGIGDVITIENEQFELPPANLGTIDGHFLSGVVQLDKQLVAVLDIAMVLGQARNNAAA